MSGLLPLDEPASSRRSPAAPGTPVREHHCLACGVWGSFGFALPAGSPTRWYCAAHRPLGDAKAAAPKADGHG